MSDQKYASVIDDYQKVLDKWNEKYSGLVKTSLEKLPDNKYTKEYKATINNPNDSRLIGSDSKENKKFAELRQKVKMIAGQDVNAYGTFWSSFKKYQESQKTNKSESEEFDFSQKTDAEPYKGPAESFGVPEIKTDGIDTTNGLNLPISVANEVFSSAEISNALENMDSNKSYAVKKDGKTYSIQPTKDGSKNVVIEIDGKRNEIKEVRLSANSDALKMLKNGGTVVPKSISDRLISTKAINLSTGNPLSVFLINSAEKDNIFSEGKMQGSFLFILVLKIT